MSKNGPARQQYEHSLTDDFWRGIKRCRRASRRTLHLSDSFEVAAANSDGGAIDYDRSPSAGAFMVERRIRMAKFPHTKSFDTFDFAAQPSLNKALVLELARSEWIEQRRNVIALGPSGTGKTHAALALGLAACQKNHSVAFTTAAALVHDLMEARDERRLRSLQKHLASVKLLILDELGYVPFTAVGGELLFEVLSQRYERGSTLITSNLPFDEWTSVFGSERLTGALLDRLTHHVHILEMNGESFRLASSRKRQKAKGDYNMT